VRADDAYTFGLFRDCGIVILLRRFGTYRDILMRANRDGERLFTHELDALPTHHAVVGSLLAQNWWLPEIISQAIRSHHDPEMLDRFDSGLPLASRRLIAIAQTAERLVQTATGGVDPRMGQARPVVPAPARPGRRNPGRAGRAGRGAPQAHRLKAGPAGADQAFVRRVWSARAFI
jgi:hypothetical protein